MCVLSREKDGLHEAVKMNRDQVQIRAWRETIVALSEPLANYCKGIEK